MSLAGVNHWSICGECHCFFCSWQIFFCSFQGLHLTFLSDFILINLFSSPVCHEFYQVFLSTAHQNSSLPQNISDVSISYQSIAFAIWIFFLASILNSLSYQLPYSKNLNLCTMQSFSSLWNYVTLQNYILCCALNKLYLTILLNSHT